MLWSMAIIMAAGNFKLVAIFGLYSCMGLENHRKSIMQYCERSELRLHSYYTKIVNFDEFSKT